MAVIDLGNQNTVVTLIERKPRLGDEAESEALHAHAETISQLGHDPMAPVASMPTPMVNQPAGSYIGTRRITPCRECSVISFQRQSPRGLATKTSCQAYYNNRLSPGSILRTRFTSFASTTCLRRRGAFAWVGLTTLQSLQKNHSLMITPFAEIYVARPFICPIPIPWLNSNGTDIAMLVIPTTLNFNIPLWVLKQIAYGSRQTFDFVA